MNNNVIRTYATILVLSFLFLFGVNFFNVSYPLNVTTTTKSSELSVVGEGKVDATPDTVYVDVGVAVSNIKTAEEAQNTISQKNNEIVKALSKLEIAESDIKTKNFSVYPNYSYENGRNNITGYNGNVTISVKSSDLSKAPKIITEVTNAGANQIEGVRYVIDNPDKYREQARQKAIDNAREQANKLAQTLGIKLGRVVNISESQVSVPGPIYYAADKASGMGGGQSAPDLSAGTQTVSSTVTLYFEKF